MRARYLPIENRDGPRRGRRAFPLPRRGEAGPLDRKIFELRWRALLGMIKMQSQTAASQQDWEMQGKQDLQHTTFQSFINENPIYANFLS